MALRIMLIALFVSLSAPVQALDMDTLVNDFIQDRRENVYETMNSLKNAIKDYRITNGEPPKNIEELKTKGYLPKDFEQDRSFGNIEIGTRKLSNGEKSFYSRVTPDDRYKKIVEEATRGFETCERNLDDDDDNFNDDDEDTPNECQEIQGEDGEQTDDETESVNIMARNPKEDASISEATIDLMRQSLSNSVDEMVKSWKGKRAEVNKDFVKLTSQSPTTTYEFRSLTKEDLTRHTYVGMMLVLKHKEPAQSGDKKYETSFTIPPIKRFNPMSEQRRTLMVFEGGDYLYVTPVNNDDEGAGLKLEWDFSQNTNITPGSGSTIKIARMILWTPSEEGGVTTVGGDSSE